MSNDDENSSISGISIASSISSSESIDEMQLDIRTSEQMMDVGLQFVGLNNVARVQKSTSVKNFRVHYGVDPHVAAHIWSDLQTTTIKAARLKKKHRSIQVFFCTLHFLKRYQTWREMAPFWGFTRNHVATKTWRMVKCIQALKGEKIGWPGVEYFGDDIWIMSVDGTHFVIQEPSHPDFPKDPSYFTYKHHCAGFSYEIGLSLFESKLVWFNGPFKAGRNDITIFREEGLLALLQSTNKKIIADSGYKGYSNLVSRLSSHDNEEVSKFKTRARLRHEKYNRLLKEFECLSIKFRHSEKRLKQCFEAVAVIVQYNMENGRPLYDI